jgi:hypothetical protein
MNKLSVVCFAALIIAGCSSGPTYDVALDQQLRQKIFCDCLKDVPKGPEVTGKSDWSKIVEKCSDHSYFAAKRVVLKDSIVNGIIRAAANIGVVANVNQQPQPNSTAGK